MHLGSPLDAISHAIGAAAFKDMPDIEYQTRDYSQRGNFAPQDIPYVKRLRRPMPHELEVIVFPQTWGSTALGYGGMGGSAMTPAYTVIVILGTIHCVYFGDGGRLAYRIYGTKLTTKGLDAFTDRIRRRIMPGIAEAEKLFEQEIDDAASTQKQTEKRKT